MDMPISSTHSMTFARPTSFAYFRELVTGMPGSDENAAAAWRERDAQLTKIPGSLGRLEELSLWFATWSGRSPAVIEKPLVAVYAASHGINDKGVSAFPAEVTKQMVANYAAGGAAINQICKVNALGLAVFPLALDTPTPDISETDAFDETTCIEAMVAGVDSLSSDPDLLCLGEMGIGNTAVASALYLALFGGTSEEWVGPGTGVVGPALRNKITVVDQAVARVKGERDPLEILKRLGGREIAAMVGAIIAARHMRIPVVVDGFVTSAAAAVVFALAPSAIDHCIFSHASAEPAHRRALKIMDKTPLFDLGMRLGEGTGAAVAASIIRAAGACHAGMATFSEAGVSNKD